MADPFILSFQMVFCLKSEVSIGDPPAIPSNMSVTPQPPPTVKWDMRGNVEAKDTVMSSPEPPSITRQSGLYETEHRTIPELSCKECRRRKSKCDRQTPKCTLCVRKNRTCEYGAKSRPLTRRYVTELESALLSLQQSLPTQGDSNIYLDLNNSNLGEATGQRNRSVDISHSPLHSGATTDQQPHSRCQIAGPVGMTQTPRASEIRGRVRKRSISQVNMPLESSPLSGNWEWDERAGRANGNEFVDGMASLTSDPNGGGYLGVASGAALLRVTDPNPNGPKDQIVSAQNIEPSNIPASSIPYSSESLGELEPFVKKYFDVFHKSYPIVHEATFRAQFMHVLPRPKTKAWEVLLFVVAAVGAFTASTQPSQEDVGLFEAAKARMSFDMLETGNIHLVQALTLISNYMQKRNKPNSGYHYMGLARRTAMAIGLHKEIQSPVMNLFEREMRRRIWHCLYIFDVGAIITFSRPLDFPSNGVDAELPMDVHDTAITQGTRTTPQFSTETTIYTHMRAQVSFHMVTSEIYSRMISTSFPSASELIEADDRLISHWLSSLPPHFQEDATQNVTFRLCHSILRWRYRNFRTLMYRPILIRRVMSRRGQISTSGEESNHHEDISIERCLQAARESVQLISTYWLNESKNTMTCWYGLYFLFQAVLIPIYCLRNDPQCAAADEWREQIGQAMRTIESMAQIIESASLFLEKIRSTQIANLYPLMWPNLDITHMDGFDTSL
ncbi:hypothetical protein N7533_008680 [Penicillium manginii]|uniref:uncharacterized protein n=1 Tax=Penicillium manginii TaxID=203109 RepID=UPI002547A7A2|nr:uncharacterized protein N7533_008680 [Penicillium manginii]KAJ5743810.1 hypothetical protein N7533_008680 [Penicillium manginii]